MTVWMPDGGDAEGGSCLVRPTRKDRGKAQATKVSYHGSAREAGDDWLVELLPNATADAFRLFNRLPTAPIAHAVTRDQLRALELFPKSRLPNHGQVLDMQ